MKIIERKSIVGLLPEINLIDAIEQGFVAYSNGQTVVPPVGEMQLEKGEVHIKYGAIRDQPFYVIKIASGFYGNQELGIPTSNGCMLLFSQETGELVCVLLDEGHLTDVRTAVAGAIAAKYLAPKNVDRIGIVGTGIQAKLQLQYLTDITACREVLVWGRSESGRNRFIQYFKENSEAQFCVEATDQISELQGSCNLIVTTTPSKKALLKAVDLRPGTHVTAVGSDTPEKQELESGILQAADLVVGDSLSQCKLRGEISQALRGECINAEDVVELGNIISGTVHGRSDDRQITIADLTGVAVQDIQIATAVYQRYAEV